MICCRDPWEEAMRGTRHELDACDRLLDRRWVRGLCKIHRRSRKGGGHSAVVRWSRAGLRRVVDHSSEMLLDISGRIALIGACCIHDSFGASRSEERREGKECVSTCRTRWCPYI